jgi:transposase InsO family protein
MCRLLQISRSGFYAWLTRPISERDRADLALMAKIEAIHRRSRGVYGSPNIHAELADDYGIHVGRKRVARLMRSAGLRGATLRKHVVTTQPDPQADRPIDLVDRQFYTDGPDRLWVADITYIPTWSGFLYLAMVLDVYSRRVVGWSMETHLRTELILAALNMAITQRQPSAVIHHSDRGCQPTLNRSSQQWVLFRSYHSSLSFLATILNRESLPRMRQKLLGISGALVEPG